MENEGATSGADDLVKGMTDISRGASLVAENLRSVLESANEVSNNWARLTAAVDERFLAVELKIWEEFHGTEESLWRSILTYTEGNRRRDQSEMEVKLTNLLAAKVQGVEERLRQTVDWRLRKLEERIRNVVSRTERLQASVAVPEGQSEDSERAVKLDICSTTKVATEELVARVTALESAVGRAVNPILPRVTKLVDKLETRPRDEASVAKCTKILVASALYRPRPKNKTYIVSTTNISSLDRELLLKTADGQLDAVRELLAAGANVNAHDGAGFTPLHMAARRRHMNIMELLLKEGADVNGGRITNTTPLHWAIIENDRRCVLMLLREGADVQATNSGGWTPLHFACNLNKSEVVELLLRCDADREARTNSGKTPLDMAFTEDVRRLFHDPEVRYVGDPRRYL